LPRFLLSRNQRLVVTVAFYAVYFILGIFSFQGFLYNITFTLVYLIDGFAILSALFGGPEIERAFTLPFAFDAVFNNVPKVFVSNPRRPYGRRKLYGRVLNADRASGRYILGLGRVTSRTFGRWLWAPMTVDLTKLEDTKTVVRIRYEGKTFLGFGLGRALDQFFELLYCSLA